MIGSIGLMDNVASELAHASDAVVVSAGYRLTPEHPYPAGLDDCERVNSWAMTNTRRLGLPPSAVVVAGESAGGNLAAAVSLRLRDIGDATLACQALIYPAVAGRVTYPSAEEFDGFIISRRGGEIFWGAYSGPNDLDGDPYVAPLRSTSVVGLPPALVARSCSATRVERMPNGFARTVSMSTRSAMPANYTGSSTSTSLRPAWRMRMSATGSAAGLRMRRKRVSRVAGPSAVG
jgi:acetyl esterase/lipase